GWRSTKRPSPPVVWLRAMLVPTFFASTATPGRAAPEGSRTLPWITPVVICGWAAAWLAKRKQASRVSVDTPSARILSIETLLGSRRATGSVTGTSWIGGTIVESRGAGQGNRGVQGTAR